jgi:translation initiation factor 4E
MNTSLSRPQIADKTSEPEKKDAKEPMTITKDFTTKHPLQNSWTLWYDNSTNAKNDQDWEQSLKPVYTFSTVEDFWCMWNNIRPASEIKLGCNYHLFKEGISPKWEDPHNVKGGKWIVLISSEERPNRLDQLWLYTVLACIGEDFVDSDEICGCVMSIRNSLNRIALWLRISDDDQIVLRIGRRYKELLGITTSVYFELHSDRMQTKERRYRRDDRTFKFEV